LWDCLAKQERLILPAGTISYQLLKCRRRRPTGHTNIADLTRTIRTYFASNSYEDLGAASKPAFERFENGAEDPDRFVGACLRNKLPKTEKFPCHDDRI
jgi:hypothetical protein